MWDYGAYDEDDLSGYVHIVILELTLRSMEIQVHVFVHEEWASGREKSMKDIGNDMGDTKD